MSISSNYSHAQQHPSETEVNDLIHLIRILIDRKLTIFLFCIGAIFLSTAYVAQLNITYLATAKIMLKSSDINRRTDILQTLLSSGKLDIADLLSQIQVMQSPEVVKNLVIDQKLFRDPEFGGSLAHDDFESLPPLIQRRIVNRTRSAIDVTPIVGTSLIDISAETNDPVKSAAIANSLGRIYGLNEESKIKEQAEQATEWLADRLEVLRGDVRKSEMALEEAREKNNLTLSQSGDSRLAKIELLTKSLSRAEANFAETSAILNAVKNAKANGLRIDTISRFLNDRLMENLKATEAGLLRQQATLKKRYGPNHPEMIALQAEFDAFQKKISDEIDTHIATLKNDLKIQKAQTDELNKKINVYRESYRNDSERRLLVKNLQTELNTSRALLNNFMSSYLKSLQGLNISKNPIRVISEAIPPSKPNVSNKILIVILGGITGLFVGIFIALVLERLQNTIKSPKQIEKLFGLSVYALIPKVKLPNNSNAADYLLSHPATAVGELVRSLFTNIQLRDPHRKSGGRVITVTSTSANEGKTTNAIWLATTAAQAGKKVLIIDADMRRPSLHKAYGLGNAKGLADYLSDRLPLNETIYTKHTSNVHIMTTKAIPTHALTLLSSDRTETMIRRLRDNYDLIIIDVPTSLVFSDARVMAKLSDKTLYVVEWKKTSKDDLENSISQFINMNYTNVSFILNKVEDKRLINFGKNDVAYLQEMDK